MEVLNKATKTVKTSNYFSRYNGLSYYYNKLDDKYQMQTKYWIKSSANSKAYVVKRGDTYDKIALEKYNNPTYYWVICDYNRIIDPFKAPKPGTTLYLPTLDFTFEWDTL